MLTVSITGFYRWEEKVFLVQKSAESMGFFQPGEEQAMHPLVLIDCVVSNVSEAHFTDSIL